MSADIINPTKGLNFELAEISGYVTGVTYGADGARHVFAGAAEVGAPEDTPLRMVHVKLGAKVADLTYGANYAVESWEWITRADFDRIVGMDEIRDSLGWRN